MRRLRRHLPDRLHLFHRQCRRTGVAQAPDCSGAEHHPGPVRVRAAEDDAGDGQGRGCVPALQSVCRTLPDRRLGHAEVPAAGDVRRPGMPQPYGKGTGMNAPAVQSGLLPALVAVNDFVVKFANVNGSGSASANELFAKAILRMGVPVSPRNIFPSNIQGLPTWYEVRVTEAGWLGRRGGVDLMVAMNPQTWNADVAEIAPGGYLFYDNSKPLPPSRFRDDVHIIGVPLTELCNAAYSEPRQRQLFKNIVYVGALSVLLDMEFDVLEKLIAEQYKSKPKLLDSNIQALAMGRNWAATHLSHPIGLRVQRADAVGERIFVDGNSAAALGCVYGGATVCAWYPITPSSSCAEAFQSYC